jgi:hypothetical protein
VNFICIEFLQQAKTEKLLKYLNLQQIRTYQLHIKFELTHLLIFQKPSMCLP